MSVVKSFNNFDHERAEVTVDPFARTITEYTETIALTQLFTWQCLHSLKALDTGQTKNQKGG